MIDGQYGRADGRADAARRSAPTTATGGTRRPAVAAADSRAAPTGPATQSNLSRGTGIHPATQRDHGEVAPRRWEIVLLRRPLPGW